MSEGYSFRGPVERAGDIFKNSRLARNFVIVEPMIGSKEQRLAALQVRRDNPVEKVNNAELVAGSLMYYYCISCGHGARIISEKELRPVNPICPECKALKALGWLE